MVGGFYNIDHWYSFNCFSHNITLDWMRIQLLSMDQSGQFTEVLKESETD